MAYHNSYSGINSGTKQYYLLQGDLSVLDTLGPKNLSLSYRFPYFRVQLISIYGIILVPDDLVLIIEVP